MDELSLALSRIGVQKDKINELISKMDADGDRTITYEEFSAAAKSIMR